MPVHHPHCGAMGIPRTKCDCTAGREPSRIPAGLAAIEAALRVGKARSIKAEIPVYNAAFAALGNLIKAVDRWQRQMQTDYRELSGEEKDSDRAEADRFLALAPVSPSLEAPKAPDSLLKALVKEKNKLDAVILQLIDGLRQIEEKGDQESARLARWAMRPWEPGKEMADAPAPAVQGAPTEAGDAEDLIPELVEMARREPHDVEDCPEDDTCRCENIRKLNAEFKAVQRLMGRGEGGEKKPTPEAGPAQDIPISDARRIAEERGYDQVVVVGRKVGDDGREHVTTYGVDKANCDVAARIGNFFKYELMKWPAPPEPEAGGAQDGEDFNAIAQLINAHATRDQWQSWERLAARLRSLPLSEGRGDNAPGGARLSAKELAAKHRIKTRSDSREVDYLTGKRIDEEPAQPAPGGRKPVNLSTQGQHHPTCPYASREAYLASASPDCNCDESYVPPAPGGQGAEPAPIYCEICAEMKIKKRKPMELNGFRFACDHGHTFECHIDDEPELAARLAPPPLVSEGPKAACHCGHPQEAHEIASDGGCVVCHCRAFLAKKKED